MTKLACVAVLVGALAGCAYPNTAMVEVAGAPPPPPHPIAPPSADAPPDDYGPRDLAADVVGGIFEIVADCLDAHAAHR